MDLARCFLLAVVSVFGVVSVGFSGVGIDSVETYAEVANVSSEGTFTTSDEDTFVLTGSDMKTVAENFNGSYVYIVYYERDGEKYCLGLSSESSSGIGSSGASSYAETSASGGLR